MPLYEYSYIVLPEKTGNLETDVRNLLECNGKSKTYAHVAAVAEANVEIAMQLGLHISSCRNAALLHDISAVIAPRDMLDYAERKQFELCEAELRFPFLLHQRISRIIAENYFGITDKTVLSAIECHTTLRPYASPMDMALFIADKIAWDQPGVPPFDAAVRAALECSLEQASLKYMTYMEDNDKILYPHILWSRALDWLRRK